VSVELIRTPETEDDRLLFVGARLWVAADAFLFLAFLFAYLYLRALDSNHQWHPPHTDPSVALGTISAALVLATAVAVWFGGRANAKTVGWAGTGMVGIAAVLQAIQLFDPGFSPSHGGAYGSVFLGFTAAMLAHLLVATYWLETVTIAPATGTRAAAELSAASVYLNLLAAVAVIGWVCLYVV
jgi:heme/copper-type cytochrome/quinol oxidase subunit 3